MYNDNNNIQLATLCYLSFNGKVLLINRNKRKDDVHHGKWNGLGGKFNTGETPDECVKREVLEESGLSIFNPIPKGFLTFPKFSHEKDWYVFVFTAMSFEGKLKECKEGSLDWVDQKDIYNLPMWEGDKFFLPLVFSDKFFSGKFEYKDNILVDHRIDVF